MDYFVLGKSLPHTFSPQVHNFFGIDYGVVEMEESGLETLFIKRNFRFCNVTVPYKEKVIEFLDEISDEAKKVGAVNTIINKNGRLCGYNTDIGGMEYALKRANIQIENQTCLILGTGATSKTAQFVLEKLGAKSIIKVGRTSEVNYENVYNLSADVVINTTPVGTFPLSHKRPIDLAKIKGVKAVLDVVYNPLETALISQGKSLNLKTANGLVMLVEQARLSENLCFEKQLPQNLTEKVVNLLYGQKRNIVLIGMPGSGKTEIGKELAKLYNRRLIDLDEDICKKTQMEIPEIFAKFGEDYFRKIEKEVLISASSKQGLIIATGGGAPCFEDNLSILKQNGFVVFVKRDLNLLPIFNRPLSQSVGVEEIYKKRKNVYEKADLTIENNKSIEEIAREIIRLYEENSRY